MGRDCAPYYERSRSIQGAGSGTSLSWCGFRCDRGSLCRTFRGDPLSRRVSLPREGFKQKILQAFLDGFRHKPETTYGTINADVCERYLPGYKRPNFCDFVLQSPWNE